MNWDDLRLFVAVASAGNFLGASAKLGVDRTTIGRRLVALESQLGTPLLVRTRAGLRLTRSGERTLALATQMEQAARAIATEQESRQEVSGLVRLAVTEALAPFLVEQGLLSLREDYPALHLELLAGSRRMDLSLGEADLALRFDPLQGAQLRARCAVRTAIGLYAAPDYLRRRGAPSGPRQLQGHQVLLPSGELAVLPEARWLRRQAGVEVALASNSLPALIAAAIAGQGLVTITDTWGARLSGLQRLFTVPRIGPRALWLVTTTEGAKRPAVAAVSRRLVQLLGASARTPPATEAR